MYDITTITSAEFEEIKNSRPRSTLDVENDPLLGFIQHESELLSDTKLTYIQASALFLNAVADFENFLQQRASEQKQTAYFQFYSDTLLHHIRERLEKLKSFGFDESMLSAFVKNKLQSFSNHNLAMFSNFVETTLVEKSTAQNVARKVKIKKTKPSSKADIKNLNNLSIDDKILRAVSEILTLKRIYEGLVLKHEYKVASAAYHAIEQIVVENNLLNIQEELNTVQSKEELLKKINNPAVTDYLHSLRQEIKEVSPDALKNLLETLFVVTKKSEDLDACFSSLQEDHRKITEALNELENAEALEKEFAAFMKSMTLSDSKKPWAEVLSRFAKLIQEKYTKLQNDARDVISEKNIKQYPEQMQKKINVQLQVVENAKNKIQEIQLLIAKQNQTEVTVAATLEQLKNREKEQAKVVETATSLINNMQSQLLVFNKFYKQLENLVKNDLHKQPVFYANYEENFNEKHSEMQLCKTIITAVESGLNSAEKFSQFKEEKQLLFPAGSDPGESIFHKVYKSYEKLEEKYSKLVENENKIMSAIGDKGLANIRNLAQGIHEKTNIEEDKTSSVSSYMALDVKLDKHFTYHEYQQFVTPIMANLPGYGEPESVEYKETIDLLVKNARLKREIEKKVSHIKDAELSVKKEMKTTLIDTCSILNDVVNLTSLNSVEEMFTTNLSTIQSAIKNNLTALKNSHFDESVYLIEKDKLDKLDIFIVTKKNELSPLFAELKSKVEKYNKELEEVTKKTDELKGVFLEKAEYIAAHKKIEELKATAKEIADEYDVVKTQLTELYTSINEKKEPIKAELKLLTEKSQTKKKDDFWKTVGAFAGLGCVIGCAVGVLAVMALTAVITWPIVVGGIIVGGVIGASAMAVPGTIIANTAYNKSAAPVPAVQKGKLSQELDTGPVDRVINLEALAKLSEKKQAAQVASTPSLTRVVSPDRDAANTDSYPSFAATSSLRFLSTSPAANTPVVTTSAPALDVTQTPGSTNS